MAITEPDIGRALGTNYLLLRSELSDEETDYLDRTRRFVDEEVGGNGILLENHVIRHMADIEAIHTFEGTETIQTLIVGREITGVSAFA